MTRENESFEIERLNALLEAKLLDTDSESQFDEITQTVQDLLRVPICLISLIADDRQWFKSRQGLDVCETSRDISFCAHAITSSSDQFIIPNALLDPRFKDNPLVTGELHIRAYAGVVIRSADMYPLGTLCALDKEPRDFLPSEIRLLTLFAELVEKRIQRRTKLLHLPDLNKFNINLEQLDDLPISMFEQLSNQILTDGHFTQVIVGSIDMPKLKSVARNFGNVAANECLAEVKRRLILAIEPMTHLVARCDVNKYVFAVYDAKNLSVNQMCEELDKNIGNRIQTRDKTIVTPVKIGIARKSLEHCNQGLINDAIEQSRIAVDMIHDNKTGNHFAVYSPKLKPAYERLNAITNKFPDALGNKNIKIHYQPKVSLSDYRICGAEALIRWHDETLGFISPLEIIDVANGLEMITNLDFYVMKRVVDEIEDWWVKGIKIPKMSINVTEQTLMSEELVDKVALLVDKLDGKTVLEFEILESCLLEDFDSALIRISELSKLGIEFSLDDFGTGYSSLAQLKRLPIHTLKLDKSFLEDMLDDDMHSSLVKHVIQIGHSQQLEVVAEGVEKHEEQVLLKSFGCHLVQGYYFSKPINNEQFQVLLEKDNGYLFPIQEQSTFT